MQIIRLKLARLVFLVGCIVPLAVNAAEEKADRTCGTVPPPYTADRTIHTPGGTLKSKFYSNGAMQREDQNKDLYRITDLDKSVVYLINLKAKTLVERPLVNKPADPKNLREDSYVDRQPQDDGTILVEAGAKKDGKKNWFDRAVCGADGIFLQRELKVPGPDKKMVTIKIVQENIKVGDVSASLFEIPAGLTHKK